jgi:hypothetical protein
MRYCDNCGKHIEKTITPVRYGKMIFCSTICCDYYPFPPTEEQIKKRLMERLPE